MPCQEFSMYLPVTFLVLLNMGSFFFRKNEDVSEHLCNHNEERMFYAKSMTCYVLI